MAAELYRLDGPEAVLNWKPADAAALVEVAEARLSESFSNDNLQSAESLARRALLETPLAADAIRVLGLVAQARGDEGRAHTLIRTAATRWLFDVQAQLLTATYYLDSGDTPAALAHLNGLLRARPAVRDDVLPALISLASDADEVPAVADLLATSPTWRSWLLERFFTEADQPLAPLALLEALEARGAAAGPDELRPYLQRLINDRLFERAYLLWVKLLPVNGLGSIPNVRNGGFDHPIPNLPFDWTFGRVRGALIEVAPIPEDPGNPALRVEFDGSRVLFQHVAQVLLLSPGNYELSVRGKAEDLRNERGMHWRISCLDGVELATTDKMTGETNWLTLGASFSVPATGCAAQQLQLELAARVAMEQQVAGRVWFDDVTVLRTEDARASGQPN